MEKLRLFIAVDIDKNSLSEIEILQKSLKKLSPDLRWTKPDTWHLTIKFLGETKKEKLEEIIKICNIVAKKYKPFNYTLKGISAFPNIHFPRVIFVDTIIPEDFKLLSLELDQLLATIGFEKETREFHPHLTLARIKDIKAFLKKDKNLMDKIIKAGESIEFTVSVSEFYLYQSILKQEGPIYIKMNSFKLSI